VNIKQLELARQRVRSFLLPSLSSISDEFSISWTESTFKGKNHNLAALARSSLRLTEEMTPEVESVIKLVCQRIQIDRNLVDVYVFPSSEYNGFCYVNDLPISVGISSSIIRSLKGNELAFVLGHEIGHALFKETANFTSKQECLEDQILSRAVEMSVDRIGLLAASECESAFRAILKTLSGLDEDILRFDFSSFMGEARGVLESKVTDQQLYSSHPPLAQRFKALVSFSSSDVYLSRTNKDTKGSLSIDQVNKVIYSGLTNQVDSKAQELINKSLEDLSIWVVSLLVVSKKQVSLSAIESHCGVKINKEDVEKAIRLIESYSGDQKANLLQEKIQSQLIVCSKMAPRATMKFVNNFEGLIPELKFTNLDVISTLISHSMS
jgi:Zn-dependent protease with chaperone function